MLTDSRPWEMRPPPWDREITAETVSLTVAPWELRGLPLTPFISHAVNASNCTMALDYRAYKSGLLLFRELKSHLVRLSPEESWDEILMWLEVDLPSLVHKIYTFQVRWTQHEDRNKIFETQVAIAHCRAQMGRQLLSYPNNQLICCDSQYLYKLMNKAQIPHDMSHMTWLVGRYPPNFSCWKVKVQIMSLK